MCIRDRAKTARLLRKNTEDEAKYKFIGKVFFNISMAGLLCLIFGGIFSIELLGTIGFVTVLPFSIVLVVLALVMSWMGINAGLPDFEGKEVVASIIWLAGLAFCASVLLYEGDLCLKSIHRYRRCYTY